MDSSEESISPGFGCGTGRTFLAGHFHERGQEFQSLFQLTPVDRRSRGADVFGHDPSYFVDFAIGPHQAANLPDVVAPAAMRAAAHLASAMQRKRNDVVGYPGHTALIANAGRGDCDPALSVSRRSAATPESENQVRKLPALRHCGIFRRLSRGKRTMKKLFGFAVLAAATCGTAFAQDDDSNWKSSEVVPGIHMLESDRGFAGGNLGLLVGDDGVVLIDDGMPTIPATTIAAVEEITGDPVNFVINTHAHGDHTGANAAFMERGATVVAHDRLRQALTEDDQYDQATLPELTFSDSVTFHLNGHTAYVFHIPNAHTSGDAGIHFTDVNVIHTGDVMFNGMFPFIDLDGGGSVDGYIAGQQKMIAMSDDRTRIIPGHGPLASKADLQAAVDMLIDSQARVKALVDQGRSLDEVKAANPLSVYDSWNWDFITTERFTETLYRSLTE